MRSIGLLILGLVMVISAVVSCKSSSHVTAPGRPPAVRSG
jgi:hypothetical protein